jgi:hypothetical protein
MDLENLPFLNFEDLDPELQTLFNESSHSGNENQVFIFPSPQGNSTPSTSKPVMNILSPILPLTPPETPELPKVSSEVTSKHISSKFYFKFLILFAFLFEP